jgi:hypothetical protein
MFPILVQQIASNNVSFKRINHILLPDATIVMTVASALCRKTCSHQRAIDMQPSGNLQHGGEEVCEVDLDKDPWTF